MCTLWRFILSHVILLTLSCTLKNTLLWKLNFLSQTNNADLINNALHATSMSTYVSFNLRLFYKCKISNPLGQHNLVSTTCSSVSYSQVYLRLQILGKIPDTENTNLKLFSMIDPEITSENVLLAKNLLHITSYTHHSLMIEPYDSCIRGCSTFIFSHVTIDVASSST
jgi:hypothetical protein